MLKSTRESSASTIHHSEAGTCVAGLEEDIDGNGRSYSTLEEVTPPSGTDDGHIVHHMSHRHN